MFMNFGIFLFTVVLFYYAILMLADQWGSAVEQSLAKKDHPSGIPVFLKKGADVFTQQQVRKISGFIAFFLALWNFFAPDFGSFGSITVIGALIPCLILFIDSLLLAPELLDWIHLSDSWKEKILGFTGYFSLTSGWLTLLFAVLHMIFHTLPFL